MRDLTAKYQKTLEEVAHWLKPEKGNISGQLSMMSVYSNVPVYCVYFYYLDKYPEIRDDYERLLRFYNLDE